MNSEPCTPEMLREEADVMFRELLQECGASEHRQRWYYRAVKWGGKKDSREFKFKRGKWYHAIIEIHGSEMVAQFDGQPPLYIEDAGLMTEKPRLVLINYGRYAWFDNLQVWKAELKENWPAQRNGIRKK